MKNIDKNFISVKRCCPDVSLGLSSEQVLRRAEAGAINSVGQSLTSTFRSIIFKNTVTLFNFIMTFLAVVLVLIGRPEQILFIGIAICNTIMGIFQEMRAKIVLDRMAVLAAARVNVIRDGNQISIAQDKLVLDDIVLIAMGDQICADSVIVNSERLEVDESMLTGETIRIIKQEGDIVLSGSYVTSGRAYARVTAVGQSGYALSITSEAKKSTKQTPRLLKILQRIIQTLTVIIIPLGASLFYIKHFVQGGSVEDAIIGTSTSVLGMIPAGLILLTSVTMTVGALKLAKRKALVQTLPSIETLARTTVLCLDKTGTITDGALKFERMELVNNISKEAAELVLSELMGSLEDTNATAAALSEAFGRTENWSYTNIIPFSSSRKWSGVTFTDRGSFILGSPGIILSSRETPFMKMANAEAAKGMRALCLSYSPHPIIDEQLPHDLRSIALLILSDNVRESAEKTFRHFSNEGVIIKVISGDNPITVGAVAAKAGLSGADRRIDMSSVPDNADYASMVEEFTVFGHVSPHQKRSLVRAMKMNGQTVCMTGDGVNDILAMRESDCSISMVGGSDAARSACDFVLLSDDFGAMIDVLKEGRRVINNIEKVASLFLLQTLYSLFLTLLYITFLIPYPYPMEPLQVTPINALTVGIPSFFLALQANYARPGGMLFNNILQHTLPAAITVVFNTLYIQLASIIFDISFFDSSTMTVFLIGIMGFYLLSRLTKPYAYQVKIMYIFLIVGFVASFTFFGELFSLTSLFNRNVFFYLPLVYFSHHVHDFLGKICRKGLEAYRILKAAGWTRRARRQR